MTAFARTSQAGMSNDARLGKKNKPAGIIIGRGRDPSAFLSLSLPFFSFSSFLLSNLRERRNQRFVSCKGEIKKIESRSSPHLSASCSYSISFLSIASFFSPPPIRVVLHQCASRQPGSLSNTISKAGVRVRVCVCGTYIQKRWTREVRRERESALVFPRCVIKRTHITFLHASRTLALFVAFQTRVGEETRKAHIFLLA